MSKSFSTLKNKMSLTAKKTVEEKTSQLLKEVLLYEIREQLHITQEDMTKQLFFCTFDFTSRGSVQNSTKHRSPLI
jgi:hypothetical protein